MTAPIAPPSSGLTREQLLTDPHTPLRPPPTVVPVPEPLAELLCVESLRAATNWRSWERGVDLLPAAAVGSAHSDADEVTMQLSGSSGVRYTQTFRRGEYKTRDHGFLTVTCTCPVGGGGRTICKHGVAAGLYLLGHTPTSAPEPAHESAPTSPAARLAELDLPTLQALLADATATHPDVAAAVLAAFAAQAPAASDPDADADVIATWRDACQAAVDGLLRTFDWDRVGKNAGDALCAALQPLRERALAAPAETGTEGLVAVLCTVLEQAGGVIGDRYGDVGQFADSCVQELLAPPRAAAVTADQQRRVATSLLTLTNNLDLLAFWRCLGGDDDFATAAARAAAGNTDSVPIAELLGTAGRQALHEELRANGAAIEEAQGAPVAQARAARASREQQLRQLTAQHRQIGALLGSVLAAG